MDEAHALLTAFQAEAEQSGAYHHSVARVFLALDDIDGTLDWLEQSYVQRHPALRLALGRASEPLDNDPRLDYDPRYIDLRRRSGLPP